MASRKNVMVGAVLSLALLAGLAACRADAADAVRSMTSDFFHAYLHRSLAEDEVDELAAGFVAYYEENGCETACLQAVDVFNGIAATLQEKDGEPEALMLRRRLITGNYFSPKMQGRLWLRLLLEPDPVRVVDPGAQRLMTESAVAGLANITLFFDGDAPPEEHAFASSKIDELVADLDRQFGDHPDARALPKHFPWAGVFWAGIEREWSHLSEEDRQSARSYFLQDVGPAMPQHLYVRLLGFSDADASQVRIDDRFARMSHHLGRQLELMVEERSFDRILGIVHGR
jgi:hypothetical protein